MTNYILKNNKESQEVLLYQEKTTYSFTPKKGYQEIKKITVLDPEMLNRLCIRKNIFKY